MERRKGGNHIKKEEIPPKGGLLDTMPIAISQFSISMFCTRDGQWAGSIVGEISDTRLTLGIKNLYKGSINGQSPHKKSIDGQFPKSIPHLKSLILHPESRAANSSKDDEEFVWEHCQFFT